MQHSSILPTPHGLDNTTAPQLASALQSRLKHAGLALWRALEASGHSRAMRELRILQGQWDSSDPELARALRQGHAFLGSQADTRRG